MAAGCGGAQQPDHSKAAAQAAATQQWNQLRITAENEARSTGAVGRWPFSAIHFRKDGLPTALRQRAREALGEPEQLNLKFNAAKYVTTSTHVPLWVVGGHDVLCLFQGITMAVACTSAVNAYRHGVVLQTYRSSRGESNTPTIFTTLGIAPDRVKTIPARIGKHWTTIPVRDNTFVVASKKPIGVPLSLAEPSAAHSAKKG